MVSKMELLQAVTRQFDEEIGDQEERPTPPKEKYMLRMKYGLSATQLTASEKYLIQKEEKKEEWKG
jgi:hypothetical protein